MYFLRIITFFLFTSSFVYSDASEINLYSINTGSFAYHASSPGKYNEYFGNEYFSIEKKLFSDSTYSLMAGTLINSHGDRCALLGLRKDWWSNYSGWTLKGAYGYSGEFFFEPFSDCGDKGVYESIKKSVGIGFAPYIYHAIQYNFTDYFGVEGGVIIPGIVVLSVQWSFK